MNRFLQSYFLLGLVLLIQSCSVSPEPIKFGEDHCAHCKMKIMDPRFGGELVTTKGRIYKFDAVECLVPYLQEHASMEFGYTLAIAYDEPKKLVDVRELHFETDSSYRSPMGGNLAAFRQSQNAIGNELITWEELKEKKFYAPTNP
ncbi:nitrous oxide reductase accessory protein NosL [Cyclobacterium jeungdonense]|uniref:Nitrous oxide reductase accessory protein NosL n=1 Tax=Cyclobacterium jeungdonense TaxID=708087 RepID=A0ABT8C7E8_9BACT|nr:nitrous oxide reductase accessory protein NosL [Cyclobacterium jeungdonense]MDN3688734.1 nitrous oxide reductase accessory protein NosL [Cyclobacterium jeungdonense]